MQVYNPSAGVLHADASAKDAEKPYVSKSLLDHPRCRPSCGMLRHGLRPIGATLGCVRAPALESATADGAGAPAVAARSTSSAGPGARWRLSSGFLATHAYLGVR